MNSGRLFTSGPVAFLLLVTSCAGTSAEDTTAATTTTTAATPATTAATTTTERQPVLVTKELTGFETRSVVFANVEFTITGVRVSNQELRSYAEGAEPVIDEENFYAYLDITALNTMTGSQTGGLGVETFRLLLDGRELSAVDEMSFLSDLTGIIRPFSSVESFLAFLVPEEIDLADGILVIGVPPDRRASLPLTGEVLAGSYPIQVELGDSAEGVGPINGGTIVFTVLDATLSEDRPHETTSPTGLRANEDELFLVVHLRAELSGGATDALGSDTFRLIVDGLPRSPWNSASDPRGINTALPIVEPGAATDVWVAFLVPIDATELALQVGDFEQDPGVIPLDLPALS